MLQAHSFLWNYLWVAPHLLLLTLAALLFRRGVALQIPSFLAFAVVEAAGGLLQFWADVTPSVSALNYWRIAWAALLVESLLKFFVTGEVFSRLVKPYSSVSRVGRRVISYFGAALVMVGAVVAAFSHIDSDTWIISDYHILSQTVFFVELGLIVGMFLFAAYFRLSWDRPSFGILFGFGLSACEHLSAWAILTNADLSTHGRTLLDFANMSTFHVCVLIWFYYLLVPHKVAAPVPAAALSENNLEVWNRELERLLQQ